MSEFRANFKEISAFVPHRPPMVWIDEIITFTESSGECVTVIQQDGHYMDGSGLRASSCLEFIAQAYGYGSMAYTRLKTPDSGPLKRAFLASFKDAMFAPYERLFKVRAGDKVTVKFSGVRQIGPITMFHGQAIHSNEVLCSTQMKVFCES